MRQVASLYRQLLGLPASADTLSRIRFHLVLAGVDREVSGLTEAEAVEMLRLWQGISSAAF